MGKSTTTTTSKSKYNIESHIITKPHSKTQTRRKYKKMAASKPKQPSVVDILKSQMTEVAKAKKEGTITTADGNPFSTSNFLRQFRDKDSREGGRAEDVRRDLRPRGRGRTL